VLCTPVGVRILLDPPSPLNSRRSLPFPPFFFGRRTNKGPVHFFFPTGFFDESGVKRSLNSMKSIYSHPLDHPRRFRETPMRGFFSSTGWSPSARQYIGAPDGHRSVDLPVVYFPPVSSPRALFLDPIPVKLPDVFKSGPWSHSYFLDACWLLLFCTGLVPPPIVPFPFTVALFPFFRAFARL